MHPDTQLVDYYDANQLTSLAILMTIMVILLSIAEKWLFWGHVCWFILCNLKPKNFHVIATVKDDTRAEYLFLSKICQQCYGFWAWFLFISSDLRFFYLKISDSVNFLNFWHKKFSSKKVSKNPIPTDLCVLIFDCSSVLNELLLAYCIPKDKDITLEEIHMCAAAAAVKCSME